MFVSKEWSRRSSPSFAAFLRYRFLVHCFYSYSSMTSAAWSENQRFANLPMILHYMLRWDDEIFWNIKDELDSINKQFSFNNFSFNRKKTKCVVFNRCEIASNFVLEVAGQSIEFVKHFKLLGVIIDGRLIIFDEHLSESCKQV